MGDGRYGMERTARAVRPIPLARRERTSVGVRHVRRRLGAQDAAPESARIRRQTAQAAGRLPRRLPVRGLADRRSELRLADLARPGTEDAGRGGAVELRLLKALDHEAHEQALGNEADDRNEAGELRLAEWALLAGLRQAVLAGELRMCVEHDSCSFLVGVRSLSRRIRGRSRRRGGIPQVACQRRASATKYGGQTRFSIGPGGTARGRGSTRRQTGTRAAGACKRGGTEGRGVTVGVAVSLAVSPLVSLAIAERDPVALRQPVERAAMDAEELGGQLLVPPRLLQRAPEVIPDHRLEAQAR